MSQPQQVAQSQPSVQTQQVAQQGSPVMGGSCQGSDLGDDTKFNSGLYCSIQCASGTAYSQVWTVKGSCGTSVSSGGLSAQGASSETSNTQYQTQSAAGSSGGNVKPSDAFMRQVITAHTSDPEYQRFLFALYRTESGTIPDCTTATRTDYHAPTARTFYTIGCYQISSQYWGDAVARSGLGGTFEDCVKPDYAIKVIEAYMARYAPGAIANREWERIARIHNKGPNGMTNPMSDPEWAAVQKFWSYW
ncbi:hypothetical protein CO180_02915 [candidate division WWE3 bacterium CG_4_9_14_3_um_filter_41_6]|nr:MAG: hypothetical protein CO180_02915 [candidate division WWE3 bacterium CG_4_9_14_3_um_filter_41_6]